MRKSGQRLITRLWRSLARAVGPSLPDRERWQAILSGDWLLSLALTLAFCLAVWNLGPWIGGMGVHPLAGSGARMFIILLILAGWSLRQRIRQVEEQEASRRLMASLLDAAAPPPPPPASVPATMALPVATGESLPPEFNTDTVSGIEPGIFVDEPAGEDSPGVARVGEARDERLLLAAASEVRRLRRQFTESLARTGTEFGERLVHRLPWYLVIGVPGAGKTTLLSRCTPTLPDSPHPSPLALSELAGTRGCDWWFSREAVLIDTAGRYTSQSSDPKVDRASWDGLLGLIREYRPQHPLNGVLVVVSVADLLLGTDEQRQGVADSIASRLAELNARFEGPLPVYLIITMADRIAGFTDYFASLTPIERRRPWGVRLPLSPALPGLRGLALGPRLDAFAAALAPSLSPRLAHLPMPLRLRAFGFPQQMHRLAPYLEAMITAVLRAQPTAPDSPPVADNAQPHLLLRGVWFTSARREGEALDLLAADQHAAFGLPPVADSPATRDESLFAAGLLTEAVLPEAWIAGQDSLSPARQHRHFRALAGLAASTAALVLWWGIAWGVNHSLLSATATEGERLIPVLARTAGGGAGSAPITDGEVTAILPLLDQVRALPEGRTLRSLLTSGPGAGGLGQGLKVENRVETLYRRALHRLLLPRMVRRLEESVALPPEADDRMFEALKIYLMLTGVVPVDRYTVLRWFTREDSTLARNAGARRSLSEHLAALFDGGYSPYSPTRPLVERARHKLVGWSQAERGWRILQGLPGLAALPGWRPAERLGPAAGLVFSRASGRTMMDPVPGFYTAAGWRDAVRPAMARVAMEMTLEGWVLGLPMDRMALADRARRLYQELASRYFEAYAAQWEQVLGDFIILPMGTMPQALVAVGALTGPDAPWRTALVALERETGFVGQPTVGTGPENTKLDDTYPLALAQALDGGMMPPAAGILLRRFQPLTRLAQTSSALTINGVSDAVLAGVLGSLERLQAQLTRRVAGYPLLPGETPVQTANQIRALASSLPSPLQRWFSGVADGTARLLVGNGAP